MNTLPTDLEAASTGIETCEARLALSASLMGAWMAPLADPWADALPTCPAEPAASADVPIHPDSPSGPAATLDQAFAQAALNLDPSGNGNSLLEQSARVAAATGFDGAGQTLAVIDSGIAYDHHAFGENGRSGGFGPGYRVVGGWDFAENDADPYDDAPAGYHGSHVAGLTGGFADTLEGNTFRGVAPGADLVALRVFDDAGAGNLAWIEQSLRWVYDNQDAFEFPITTVNLSLGTELTDLNREYAYSLLEDELQLLHEDDILVFAAAGNGQLNLGPTADDLMYPASSPWVSAVGSVDTNGHLSGFSQRADGMFVAEGQRLQSSVPEHVQGYDGYLNDYSSLSGTSMASPQVAAASALVRQAMQQAGLETTSESILQRLQDTSVQRIDPVTGVAYQSLDLEAAVDFNPTEAGEPGEGENTTTAPSTPAPGTPPLARMIDGYVGTDDGDRLQIDLREIVNGGDVLLSDNPLDPETSAYRLVGSPTGDPIVIDAGSGSDTLKIFGSAGDEQLTLRPTTGANAGSSLLTFAGGTLELRGFENVVFAGEGGEDRATLYDSDGNDDLRSSPDNSQLTGVGFEFHLEQVDKLYVYATAGGNDTAHLTDSAYDDQLVIRPQFSSLRGGDHFQAAFGFERVFAYAESGGHDRADLGDSAADDVMSISSTRSLISGSGYRASALGFESVQATASQGGDDTVRIYVDDPNGQWHTTDSLTQWTGAEGTSRIARGFERSEAFENFETVPVGSQGLAQAPIATQAWRSLAEIQQETDDHLRGLQQLFEELAT